MAEKILMIALSPTMETGTVARWRKKEGEQVKSGDVICEVETDKATMDYETTAEGTLLKIVVPEGGQAKVGDLIAVVGAPGEDISALLGAPRAAPPAPSPAAAAEAPKPSRLPARLAAHFFPQQRRGRLPRPRRQAGSAHPPLPAGWPTRRASTCVRSPAAALQEGS